MNDDDRRKRWASAVGSAGLMAAKHIKREWDDEDRDADAASDAVIELLEDGPLLRRLIAPAEERHFGELSVHLEELHGRSSAVHFRMRR